MQQLRSVSQRFRAFIGAGLLAIVSLMVPTSGAQAAAILYFNDLSVGTDRMGQALASPAITSQHTVTTATSPANFATLLGGGGFQLAIFFQQNASGADYNSAFAALATHIANGGLAIADDWTRNGANAAAFQVSFPGGGINQTQFTVTDSDLAFGLTNPVNLFNPGWGIFSYDESTGAGISGAAFPIGSAIIIGNDGRTIFNGFLSDTFVDGPQGVQLYINEINRVFAIPEPATLAVFGLMGIAGAGYALRRRKVSA